uniref:C2H2-type domain-containing protein n=1 Tax=Ditylenchus dipsaci TaxID=166011 RepID=A0A915DYH7_9BILA
MPSDPIKDFVKKLCDNGASVVETMEKAVEKFGDKAPSMNSIYMWRRKSRGGNGERSPHYHKYSQIKKKQKFCELCNKEVSSHLYLEFHLINTHNVFMGENKRVFQYMEGMAPEELQLCVFKCDICEVELKSLEALRKHKLDEHRQRMKIPRRFGTMSTNSSMLDCQPTKSSAGSDTANSSMLNFMEDNWEEEDNKELANAEWDDEMGDEPIMTIMQDGRIEMDDGMVRDNELDEKHDFVEPTELLFIKKANLNTKKTCSRQALQPLKIKGLALSIDSTSCLPYRWRRRRVVDDLHSFQMPFLWASHDDFDNNIKHSSSDLVDKIRQEEASHQLTGFQPEVPVQIESEPQKRAETHQKVASDQDDSALFAGSVAACLRLMEQSAREYAKMKIQQVLYECGHAKKGVAHEYATVQSPKE